MSSIAFTPVEVSILVYMAVSYAVKSLAPLGIYRCFNSFNRSVEFLTKEGNKGGSCFILKSSHGLNMAGKLLTQLTTGRYVMGDLWTFGMP